MRPSARFILAILAFSCVSLPLTSVAADVEIEFGRSYMDSHAANTVFVEGVLDSHVIGSSRFHWSPDFSFGWINGRNLGIIDHGYRTRDDIWLGAAGARLSYGDQGDWYRHLFVSFQPALHTGQTMALSSAYEFVTTLGWQGKHFSVQFRHISNASIHDPNRGETMALVGITL